MSLNPWRLWEPVICLINCDNLIMVVLSQTWSTKAISSPGYRGGKKINESIIAMSTIKLSLRRCMRVIFSPWQEHRPWIKPWTFFYFFFFMILLNRLRACPSHRRVDSGLGPERESAARLCTRKWGVFGCFHTHRRWEGAKSQHPSICWVQPSASTAKL